MLKSLDSLLTSMKKVDSSFFWLYPTTFIQSFNQTIY